ncbi:MAG: MerC domain-containing protein [Bacteroidota bacterium]
MKNTPSTPIFTYRKSDLFGVLASSLCLLHCLATPFIFVVQACSARCGGTGHWRGYPSDFLFLVLSMVAIYYSAKTTRLSWIPTVLYAVWGLLIFLIANGRFQFLDIAPTLVYLPAFVLVYLHAYDRKMRFYNEDGSRIELVPLESANEMGA